MDYRIEISDGLSEEYKSMMDEILEKHENGKLNYLTKEEFLESIYREY